jgi:hypothetical protein
MELLPAEVRENLPKLYAQEGIDDPTVHLKFFFPAADWTWFATEGQPEGDDFTFFGYVIGFEREWGYFSLRKLEEINVHHLTVERDLFFEPEKMSVCLSQWKSERGACDVGF